MNFRRASAAGLLAVIGFLIGEIPVDIHTGHPADSLTLLRPTAEMREDVRIFPMSTPVDQRGRRLVEVIGEIARIYPNAVIAVPDAPLHCCDEQDRSRLATTTATAGRLVLGWDISRRGSPWGVTGAVEVPTEYAWPVPAGFVVCQKAEDGPALAQAAANLARGVDVRTALPQCILDPTWWGGGAAGVWTYSRGSRYTLPQDNDALEGPPAHAARVVVIARADDEGHLRLAQDIEAILHQDTLRMADWPRLSAILLTLAVVLASHLWRWPWRRHLAACAIALGAAIVAENLAYRLDIAAAIGVPVLTGLAMGSMVRPRRAETNWAESSHAHS